MGFSIIDRRKNDKGKSTDNRQRFIKRVKQQVKQSVKDTIRDGSVGDLINGKDKKIKIPGKGLSKPTFHHSKSGGVKDWVAPGNKEFNQGDRVNKPSEKDGDGREGSGEGEGDDGFSFNLNKEEFLDIFFEDLELPDLIKRHISVVDEYENRRAGFSIDGNPSRLNILQSLKRAKGRRLGLRSPKKKKLKKLLAQLVTAIDAGDSVLIGELNDKINALKKKIKVVPFLDDMDLRYNRWENVPIPTTQAVMFGIMDVSASMGDWEQEMAKRFFMLMLLFLHRNYERVDIVWIRHHSRAMEVDEDEFFHSHETGGTVVSGALQLMQDIIAERYPTNQWNIFGCQISDGDNWSSDTPTAVDIMRQSLLPQSQYFAYIEVDQYDRRNLTDLWPHYKTLSTDFDNMEMAVIHDVSEIYPVFRSLFETK